MLAGYLWPSLIVTPHETYVQSGERERARDIHWSRGGPTTMMVVALLCSVGYSVVIPHQQCGLLLAG